jgi:hypothetical protein
LSNTLTSINRTMSQNLVALTVLAALVVSGLLAIQFGVADHWFSTSWKLDTMLARASHLGVIDPHHNNNSGSTANAATKGECSFIMSILTPVLIAGRPLRCRSRKAITNITRSRICLPTCQLPHLLVRSPPTHVEHQRRRTCTEARV